jgi:hypothetical protein
MEMVHLPNGKVDAKTQPNISHSIDKSYSFQKHTNKNVEVEIRITKTLK